MSGEYELDFDYVPLPRQGIFLTAPADERFYGGAAGGGKTDGLLVDKFIYHLTWPGTVGVFFRRTYPELEEVIARSQTLYPETLGTYNQGARRWTLANGSRFYFRHMEDDRTPFRHQGASYQHITFDEMTHFSQFQVSYLRDTRLRSDDPEVPLYFTGASNPGSVGHVHVRDSYVEPPMIDCEITHVYSFEESRWKRVLVEYIGRPAPFTVWKQPKDEVWKEQNDIHLATGGEGELPRRSRVFVPALLEDNEYYNRDGRYRASLAQKHLDPILRAALLSGDWSRFLGQFFEEFDPEDHVIEPMSPPLDWPKWGSIDWGYSAPLAMLWHTYDFHRDTIITYKEVYKTKMSDGEVIEQMRGDESDGGGWGFTWYGDPSMWTRDSSGTGQSKADIYGEAGIDIQPGNNNRLAGWGRIHSVLAKNPVSKEPGWQITSNCRNLIRTLPKLVRDENRIEDVDTDGEDHAADAARYGILSRPQIWIPSGDWNVQMGEYVRR